MNVKYLGTRVNKRQARGRESGKRYSYSSGHPNFTMDDRDAIQFRGELEDGNPKFCVECTETPGHIVFDGTSDTLDDSPGYLVGISKLSVKRLTMALGRMDADELRALRTLEAGDRNRAGAIKAIDKAIG